jgi:hypothetical protein
MLNTQIILLIFLSTILYFKLNPKEYHKIYNKLNKLLTNNKLTNNKLTNNKLTNNKLDQIETWRDLPFVGTKDTVKYNINSTDPSRNNPSIYYPISTPLEDNYYDYINSISSPKLSMLRSIMRRVELHSNQGSQPIIFNYSDRPVELKQSNKQKINVLANTIIDSINEFGKPMLKVELLEIQNDINEETETQSRMCFDMKIKLYYMDSEQMGKNLTFDILYMQPEFIFEKYFETLIEDQFFDKSQSYNFKAFLSKLIIIGSEHAGFLPGRNKIKKRSIVY